MPENVITPEGQPDYFKSTLDGKLSGSIKDQVKTTGGADLPLSSMESLWGDSKVKDQYNSKFGEKAFEQFSKDYKNVETSYNAYQYAINNKNIKDSFVSEQNKLFEDNVDLNPQMTTVSASTTGALHRGDIYTQEVIDPRQTALNQNNGFIDSEGKFVEFATNPDGERPGFWQGVFMSDEEKIKFDPTNNPNYVNAQGKQIKQLVYASDKEIQEKFPNEQFDDLTRGVPYIKALYYGDEIGGNEAVSKYDYMGVTSPKLSASVGTSLVSAIPRGIVKAASGIQSGVANTLIGFADAMDDSVDENGYRAWLQNMTAEAGSSSISTSANSKSDSWTAENIVQLPVDIGIQLLTGGAIAKGVATIGELGVLAANASKLSQAKKAISLSTSVEEMASKQLLFDNLWNASNPELIAKAARAASISSLTAMSVSDSRDQAIAAGFTPQQAGVYSTVMVGAMFAANRAFSWADKGIESSQFRKEVLDLNKDKLAYMAKAMEQATTPEAKQGIFSRGMKSAFDTTKNALAKISVSKMASSDYTKEASEEVLENTAQYLAQALNNKLYDKSGQNGNGFIGVNDPNYWSQFWTDTGMSAAGGAFGAGLAKVGFKIFNKGRDTEGKASITNIILRGEGGAYLKMLESMHDKGALGSKNLSTSLDKETGNYASMGSQANGLSHNDANYQLLLNEYNSLSQVINGLGVPAIHKMIKTNSDFKDQDLAGIAINKTQELTTEYLDIVSKNVNLVEAAIDGAKEFKDEDEKNKYFENLATIYPESSTDDLKRIYEIKKELKNINSGRYNEKFILKRMAINTIFDNDSEKSKAYEKYGPNFLDNIIDSYYNKKDDNEIIEQEKLNGAVANEKFIDGLKYDLSNIDSIKDLTLLSKKGKEALRLKEEQQIIDPKILASIREVYKNTFLNDVKIKQAINDGVNIMTSDPLEMQVAGEVLSNLYEHIINTKLNNIVDFKSLLAINKLIIDPLALAKEIIDPTSDLYFPIPVYDDLDSNDKARAIKEATQLAITTYDQTGGHMDINFSFKSDPGLQFKGEKNKIKQIQDFIDKVAKTKSIIDGVYKNAEDESSIVKKVNDFSSVYDEIYGDKDKIELGPSLIPKINSLTDDYNRLTNGVRLFNDVTETEKLLNQLRIKKDLLDTVDRFHTNINDYKNTFENIKKLVTKEKLANNKNIIEVLHAIDFENKFSNYFNKAFYDVRLHKMLFDKKSNGSIDGEESEMLDRLNLTASNLEFVKKRVNDDIAKLEIYLVEANNNSGKDNELGKRIETTINATKISVDATHKFAVIASDDNTLTPEQKQGCKNFVDYFISGFKPDSKSKDDLKRDKEELYKIYDVIRTISPNTMENIASSLYTDLKLKHGDTSAEVSRLLIASKMNIRDFNFHYFELVKDKPYAAYVDQESVALSATAHIITDVSNVMSRIITKNSSSKPNINNSNVMVLLGAAGSGKSTFGLGIGISVANTMSNNNNKSIVVTSNNDNQVKTLINTAKEFGFINSVQSSLSLGKLEGLKSALELALQEKRDSISKGRKLTPNLDILSKVKVLVFDEATIPSEFAMDQSVRDKTKYDLNQILNALDELNLPIKVIFSGDNLQNGYVEVTKQGSGNGSTYSVVTKNIGRDANFFFSTPYLNMNRRSKVSSISDFSKQVKSPGYNFPGDQVGNNAESSLRFISTYGVSENGALLGVRIVNEDDSVDPLNDDEFITHLSKIIEDYEAAGKVFTVGLVFNDSTKSKDSIWITPNGDSKLEALAKKYPENFLHYTHEEAQGQSFDYTICSLDKPTFKDGPSFIENGEQVSWLHRAFGEQYIGKKLGTTVERSRLYTLVINKTARKFTSEESKNLSAPSENFTEAVVSEYKNFLVSTDPSYTTPATTTTEDKNTTNSEDKENDYHNLVKALAGPTIKKIEPAVMVTTGVSTTPLGNSLTNSQLAVPALNADLKNKKRIEDAEYLGQIFLINKYPELSAGIQNIIEDEGLTLEEKKESIEKLINDKIEKDSDKNELIIVEDGDNTELEIMNSIDTEEDKLSDKVKSKIASEVQAAYFLDLGLMSAYTSTNQNIPNSNENLKQSVVSDLQSYDDAGLFKYELVNSPMEGINALGEKENYDTGFIKATLLKDTKDGLAGSFFGIRIFTPDVDKVEDTFRKSQVYQYKTLLQSGDISLSRFAVKNIIKSITPGNVKSGQKTSLESFIKNIKEKNPGIKISSSIYINTVPNHPFRGNSFLLYTYNPEVDLNDEFINKSSFSEVNLTSIGKKFSKLDNGVGIIRLNSENISVEDFYSTFKSTRLTGDSEGTKHLMNDYTGGISSTQLLCTLATFLKVARAKYNIATSEVDSKIAFILEKTPDGLFNKGENTTDAIKVFESKCNNILDSFDQETVKDFVQFLTNHFSDSQILTSYEDNMAIKHKIDLFGYKVGKDGGRVTLMNLRVLMDYFQQYDDNMGGEKEIINLFSKVIKSSHKFSNGMYAWPEMNKNKRAVNKTFGTLNRSLEDIIEDESVHGKNLFSVSIDSIQSPLLYLSIENILNLSQANNTESTKKIISKFELLLNKIDSSSIEDIDALSDEVINYMDKASSSEKIALEEAIERLSKSDIKPVDTFSNLTKLYTDPSELQSALDKNVDLSDINILSLGKLGQLFFKYYDAKNNNNLGVMESLKSRILDEISPVNPEVELKQKTYLLDKEKEKIILDIESKLNSEIQSKSNIEPEVVRGDYQKLLDTAKYFVNSKEETNTELTGKYPVIYKLYTEIEEARKNDLNNVKEASEISKIEKIYDNFIMDLHNKEKISSEIKEKIEDSKQAIGDVNKKYSEELEKLNKSTTENETELLNSIKSPDQKIGEALVEINNMMTVSNTNLFPSIPNVKTLSEDQKSQMISLFSQASSIENGLQDIYIAYMNGEVEESILDKLTSVLFDTNEDLYSAVMEYNNKLKTFCPTKI